MKMAAFWDSAQCGLVDADLVSEGTTASIIRAIQNA
jgi:hypothetical protein